MNLKNMMKPKGGVPKAKDEFDQEDLNKGMADEAKEHPWLSPAQVRRLTTDHLKMCEDYYEDEGKDE